MAYRYDSGPQSQYNRLATSHVIGIGPKGSFTNDLMDHLDHWGMHVPGNLHKAPKRVLLGKLEEVTAAVLDNEDGALGVLPLHTWHSQDIKDTHMAIWSGGLVIEAEASIEVNYVLAGLRKSSIERFERAYSYSPGHLATKKKTETMGLEPHYTASTSAAAEKVWRRHSKKWAAICSRSAADRFHLRVFDQTFGQDFTTFVIARASGNNPTTVEGIRKFEEEETVVVTGLMAPRLPEHKNGTLIAANYLVGPDPSSSSISTRIRGFRSYQREDVGGDQEVILSVTGSAKEVYDRFNSGGLEDRASWQYLGAYLVGSSFGKHPVLGQKHT